MRAGNDGTPDFCPVWGVKRVIWNKEYSTMQGLPPAFKRYFSDVDRCVASFFPRRLKPADLRRYLGRGWEGGPASAHTRMLSRPVWDLMSRRGKRWRPIFGRLLLESLGAPWPPFRDLMTVIPELNHTGSLIIDDIEDNSPLRRGGPAIHLRYGLGPSINAANTVYFLPYRLIHENRRLQEEQKSELYRIMLDQMVRSHFGQSLDLFWSERVRSTKNSGIPSGLTAGEILGIYELKTAAGIAGLAEYAAVLARAPAPRRRACVNFSRRFATAFQIADDVLGLAAGPDWRKQPGEDLAEGKITYVVFRALEKLSTLDRRRLFRILKTPPARRKKNSLREGMELVGSSGALEICRREALEMAENGWRKFRRAVADSRPRRELRRLCDALLGVGRRV